jgi:two-component system, cell cycle sensor histidine kinase and response regulator CckA
MCSVAGVARHAGGTLILVAEDEDIVRGFVSRALRSCGFEVVEARDGKDALTWAASYGGRIDLLLTDCIMPRLDGIGLSEQLTLLHPETQVLFMTGCWVDLAVPTGLVLQKPFRAADLIERVGMLLSNV